MNALLLFMLGITIVTLRRERRSRPGVGTVPLLLACLVLTAGYLSVRVV